MKVRFYTLLLFAIFAGALFGGLSPANAGQCFYYSVKIDYSKDNKATKVCRSDMTQAQKDACEPFKGCGCILKLDESGIRTSGSIPRCMENDKSGGIRWCQDVKGKSECKTGPGAQFSNLGEDAFLSSFRITAMDDCLKICSAPLANGFAAVKCSYYRSGFNKCEDVLDRLRSQGAEEEQEQPPTIERGQLKMPDCAYRKNGCDNINALLELVINIGDWIFGFLGGVALAVFVYGGFVVITSFGNAEKVKKGYSILGAALIGMAIAVSAYLLVDFILDALTVKDEFRSVR